MHAFLTWTEATWLGHFMRESGPWTYAFVHVLHLLGVAALFGSVLVIDLRLLGLGRRVPLASLPPATTPISIVGLLVALLTGAALLATKATAYANNPFLLIKFPAIGLGLLNVTVLNALPAWRSLGARDLSATERRQLAISGAISLTSWLTAIVCGRMLGYW